ncbi:MAG: helix-turn-helix domain-containing protein [Pseudorhodoplanes sp.]
MKSDDRVTRGSGNIFADIGLPNAEEHLLKARFALLIKNIIEQRGLTQTAAAKIIGLAQPDLSKLIRGHLAGFSLERLLGYVNALGRDVEIKIKPAKKAAGHTRVVAA